MTHNPMRSGFALLVAFATALSLVVPAPSHAVNVTIDAPCSGSWNWNQGTSTLSCVAATGLSCSPTVSPANPLPANPVAIGAGASQCPGAATWAWTADTTNVAACPKVSAGSSSSTLNLAAPNVTTPACTYKVAVTDGGARTGTGSASVTWTTATTPALANCQFASPPGPATAGVAFPVTVVCDNGPPTNAATFVWHQYCAGCAETSSQTSTGSNTLTLPTTGSWYVWVSVAAAGNNGTGRTPLALLQVNAATTQTSGPYDCGAEFANTRTVPLAWTNGVGNIHAYTASAGHFGPNDAVVVEIAAPSQIGTSSSGWISYYDSPPAPSVQRVAVLSDRACDFTRGLDGAVRAFMGGNIGTINFNTTPNDYGLPVMAVANRKYFLNLKNVPGMCKEAYCDLDIEFSVPK